LQEKQTAWWLRTTVHVLLVDQVGHSKLKERREWSGQFVEHHISQHFTRVSERLAFEFVHGHQQLLVEVLP
jgi:hypothetical protein